MLKHKEITSVIKLIQNFGIATNAKILHAILPFKMSKNDFENELNRLQRSGQIKQLKDLIFIERYNGNKKSGQIAKKLFLSNIKYLKLCAHLPWVRFISLTGTNAYEYCQEKDDIDLFVISAPNRLWIVYVMIVILTKLINRRPLFCFNYLIDENNLSTPQKTYHNAIQLFMMKPLLNGNYKRKIFEKNPWIKIYLPNAIENFEVEEFYRLRSDFKRGNGFLKPLDWINDYIFKKYKARLARKFPASINKGLMLSKGLAKLHMIDKSALYDDYLNIDK